jgi:hypothetical protein
MYVFNVIRIYFQNWIRTHIRLKSWIRIRIESMRIRNIVTYKISYKLEEILFLWWNNQI